MTVALRQRRLKRLLVGCAIAALVAASGSARLRAALGDTRTLAFYNIHTKETTTVLYKKDGKWVAGAKDQLDWALRDWRRNEKTAMDPALYDLLWDMHTELGSKEPIHLISAFRSRNTNEMLRSTVGGQASESRHILGKAADVHFPDVDLKQIRYSALVRERGGVGYYPTSALPFVHVDTDRVRHWPRLPRYELALLFPDGRTQHQPADGGPITAEDARIARVKHGDVAQQVAAFHDFRSQPKLPVAVADAAAVRGSGLVRDRVALAAPQPVALAEPPRIVDRPSRLTGPSIAERQKLTELMQLAAFSSEPRLLQAPQPARRPATLPSLTGNDIRPAPAAPAVQPPRVAAIDPGVAGGPVTDARMPIFVPAPAFDEEHPEELYYRPFPIAPLLTASASPDDPVLATLQAPDVAETLKLLDQVGGVPPLKLRPGRQAAAMMWAQQFSGQAVRLHAFAEPEPSGLTNRRVTTSAR